MPRGFGGEAGAGLPGWEAELFLGREGEELVDLDGVGDNGEYFHRGATVATDNGIYLS